MKIGIDVESGERPFNELVEGVLYSSSLYPSVFFFVICDVYKIRSCFPKISNCNNIVLVDSKEVITMDDSPIFAVKKKRKSGLVIGIELLKNRTIDYFFTPGNTGAAVVASQLFLGLFPGLKRPALCSFFPRMSEGETLILDVGANPELKEDYVYHNALLGSILYKAIYSGELPRVGLLSIGTEFGKGNHSVKKAYSMLSGVEGFIGNVEPYNIIDGSVDVVVCDGFTGNTIIKTAESLKKLFSFKFKNFVKESVKESVIKKMMFAPLKKIIANEKVNSDFTDNFLPKYYGGAPLLGVKGGVFIGHGKCNKKDIINAIDFIVYCDKIGVNKKMADEWKNR